jgi:hypothetical protein
MTAEVQPVLLPVGGDREPVTYLDVGAVRIQSYLARTRRLWGRRGASAVLAERAAPGRNQDLLAPWGTVEVRENTEAGQKDGVVSVIVDSTDDGVVAGVAERIAGTLARDLPGLHLTASWASAPTYLQAYQRMRQTGPHLQWLAPVLEFPASLLCQECGLDAATDEITVVDDRLQVCPDCFARRNGLDERPAEEKRRSLTRHPVVVRRTSEGIGTFTVEAALLAHFDAQLSGRKVKATKDFRDLAEQVADRRRNHLATIAADGNSLGRLFHAAAKKLAERENRPGESPDGKVDLRELSRDVTAATREAVFEAATAVFHPDRDRFMTVVPHILGGDDVLVSVPADRAWPFVRALLGAFDAGTEHSRRLRDHARELGIPTPSLSAAVVISHAALPFGQQVALAEVLLEQAKADVAGDGYSVAWLDTTADGAAPVANRRSWTLAELNGSAEGLTALSGTPQAARSTLAHEIRTPDPELAQRRVVSRLGRQEPEVVSAVHAYLDFRGRNLLTAEWKAPELVTALRDGLSLARWWR